MDTCSAIWLNGKYVSTRSFFSFNLTRQFIARAVKMKLSWFNMTPFAAPVVPDWNHSHRIRGGWRADSGHVHRLHLIVYVLTVKSMAQHSLTAVFAKALSNISSFSASPISITCCHYKIKKKISTLLLNWVDIFVEKYDIRARTIE